MAIAASIPIPVLTPDPDESLLYLYKSEEGYKAIIQLYDAMVKQIGIPVESRYVDTRFGSTHMLVCGPKDAEPLILVQGVASSAPLWHHQIPALAEHFRVYALDIVGQPGKSAPNPLSFLNDEYWQWLTDISDALHIERAHFMGISSGAWKIMRMAISAPERVRKVVLLSPMGLSHARLPWKIWLRRVMKKSKDADALEEELTAKSLQRSAIKGRGSFGVLDRQVARAMALCTRHFRIDRALKIHDPNTGRISYVKGFRVLRRFLLSEPKSLLRKMQAEGLIMFGEHDILYNPYKVAARAKKLLPHVKVDVIKGSGHGCIYDQPEECNRKILDFLKPKPSIFVNPSIR